MRGQSVARLAGPAAVLLLSVLFCWKLVLTDQYTWLDTPDLAYQVLPWFQFEAGEWHRGHFPSWDPYHWAGQPLVAQAQPGAVYPLNWILFSLPLRNGWIRESFLHWYYLLLHALAALFFYALARDLGRSRAAAVIAACIFAFTGFVGTNDWPQMLNGAIWAPLVLLFVLRAFRGIRPIASGGLAGLFLGISWLSGHHQIPIFLTLTIAGVWLWSIFESGRIQWIMLQAASACGLVMLLVSAMQTLPALEYGRISRRWVGLAEGIPWNQKIPYFIHTQFSFTPDSLLGIVLPGIHRHTDAFMGTIAVSLAVLGLWTAIRHPAVKIAAAISLGGLLLALGGLSLLDGILYALVPMVEKARSPSMAAFIFNFGFSILCCYGIDQLRSHTHVKKIALALGCFGAFVLLIGITLELAGKQMVNDRALVSGFLALLCSALLFSAPNLSRRALTGILAVLVFTEIGLVFGYYWPNRFDPERTRFLRPMAENSDLAEYLHTRIGAIRVDVDDKEIPFNFGDWHGIEQINGYLASLTQNITYMETHTQRAQELFAVTHFISKQPKFPGQTEVFTGSSGLKVFVNPWAFPRAWVIHATKVLQARSQFAGFISDQTNQLRTTGAFLRHAPDLQACTAPEEVQLVAHEPARVKILANLHCQGMVVLADTYFPGWSAAVDRKPAEIWEVDGCIRGVVVSPGAHVIEMRYAPASLGWGAILTIFGVFLALGLAFIPAKYIDYRPPVLHT
jgi:hypothetical protein